jgi:hypothetical protein
MNSISPNNGKLSIEEQLAGKTVNLTQFGRAMEELGINIIKAGSPQAKGRIEKLWDTLQDRLKAELKIMDSFTFIAIFFNSSVDKSFSLRIMVSTPPATASSITR